MKPFIFCFFLLFVFSTAVWAGKADVLAVSVTMDKEGIFSFAVTIQHADDGWEHYADQWDVLAPDGTVLGSRILMHPHDKRPFTRSLQGVKIPAAIKTVTVKAHDKVHGWGGKSMSVDLPSK